MNDRKNTLSLLSGKGGSGKTVIALSMSKVLAEAGYKVLLIDCDLSTHGATYFFESELESSNGRVLSTIDLLSTNETQNPILKTKMGFAFIPSTSNPSEIIEPINLVSEQALQSFSRKIEKICDKYDALIFDCQAGYSPIAATAIELSQRNLIVLEPDAVSSAALRVLYLQLGKKLRSNNTWQIFNKLTEEERPIYEKIFGGTLFTNLPPIPFDWQVRAAFATSEIPGVTSKWSAFGLGIMRVMQTLFPAFKEKLGNLEEKSVGTWHSYLTERINFLQEEKHKVQYEEIEKMRRFRLRRIRTTTVFTAYTGLAVSIAAALAYTHILPWEKLLTDYSSILGIAAGVVVSIYSLFWYMNSVKEVEAERKQDLQQQSLGEIENELKKYITLIATDPRLKEYEKKQIPDPITFFSCFISYSWEDKEFARLLHERLEGLGIRCWLDEHQLRPGDNMRERINQGIRLGDKVLLCASKSSLTSSWVDHEIGIALKKEMQILKERGQNIVALIPLDLDGYLFSTEYQSSKKAKLASRMAVSFVGWDKNRAVFNRELEKLVQVLIANENGKRIRPQLEL
jgi:cellulose biosynthesis protein BcsQ